MQDRFFTWSLKNFQLKSEYLIIFFLSLLQKDLDYTRGVLIELSHRVDAQMLWIPYWHFSIISTIFSYRDQKIWNRTVTKTCTVELVAVSFLFPLHKIPSQYVKFIGSLCTETSGPYLRNIFIWSYISEIPDKRFSTKHLF